MTLKQKSGNKTETTNERKQNDLIGLSNGYKRAWVSVGQATARVKNLHARDLSRNQSITRFDVILQHQWPIKQRLLHIRVFFGGKTKRSYFDLFVHWLIKQITNTYRNHFSTSYENRSNAKLLNLTISKRGLVVKYQKKISIRRQALHELQQN